MKQPMQCHSSFFCLEVCPILNTLQPQKTNIIRDYLEDINEIPKSRMFWPREIWSKYVNKLEVRIFSLFTHFSTIFSIFTLSLFSELIIFQSLQSRTWNMRKTLKRQCNVWMTWSLMLWCMWKIAWNTCLLYEILQFFDFVLSPRYGIFSRTLRIFLITI